MQDRDAELIARFLAEDGEAVATVDRWLVQAAHLYRRRLGEAWEDALQDLRLEVARLLQKGLFRGEASLKTYLHRVASHACLNRIRSQTRWQWTDLEDVPIEVAETGGDGSDVEVKDLLLRILARTSADCRRLWTMIAEGYSYSEMSERLGVREGALRVRVLRCRRRALEVREELLADGG